MRAMMMAAALAVAGTTASAATVSIDFEDVALGEYGNSLTLGDYVFSSDGVLSVIEAAANLAPSNLSRLLSVTNAARILIQRLDGGVFYPDQVVAYALQTVPSNFEITADDFLTEGADAGSGFEPEPGQRAVLYFSVPMEAGGTPYNTVSVDIAIASGQFAVDNIVFDDTLPSPVPLPASAWLLGAALAGLGLMRRRVA